MAQIVPFGVTDAVTDGVEGVFTVTDNVLTADEPQVLLATTWTLPVEPEATALMEVEDEEPVHPLGKVHV